MGKTKEKMEKAEHGWLSKLWIFLAGFSNFFLGYAFYYAFYNTDREVALRFRSGANTAIICGLIAFVVGIICGIDGIDIFS